MKILEQRKYLNSSGFIAINIINEILVSKFLNKEILFSDIVPKLLGFLNSRTVKNYLKNNRIQHINDVFKAYNFYRSLLV
jgi:1-deoxy-D-xylulose 5-phosphate reductoisomerase